MDFLKKSLGGMLGRRDSGEQIAVSGSLGISNTISVERALRECPTVYACVNLIARTISDLDIICDTPGAQAVMDRPNTMQTRSEYIYSVVFDTLAWGNSFSRVVRRGTRGQVIGLLPFAPNNATAKWVDGQPAYTLIDAEGGRFDLSGGDIVHFRDGGSADILAESRIKRGASTIIALIAANKKISETFRHGLFVGTLLKPERPLTPKQKQALLTAVRGMFGGEGTSRGGALLLENVDLEQVKSVTPADAELQMLRQDLIREVCGLWSVPPFAVGASGTEKYSNISARQVNFYRDCLSPIITYLSQRLSVTLGTDVRFDTAGLMAGDLVAQASVATQVSGRPLLSGNEARTLLGYPESDDPGMDRVLEQSSMPGNTTDSAPRDRPDE